MDTADTADTNVRAFATTPHAAGFAAEYEAAFAAWRAELAESDACAFDVVSEEPEIAGWLRSVFIANGSMPIAYFGPLVLARRAELAQAAVDGLRAAYRRHSGNDAVVPVHREAPWDVFEMGVCQVDQCTVYGMTTAEVAVEAADGFQDYAAAVYREVWPTCTVHGCGVHPGLTFRDHVAGLYGMLWPIPPGRTGGGRGSRTGVQEGAAVWWCRVGEHVVGEITPS